MRHPEIKVEELGLRPFFFHEKFGDNSGAITYCYLKEGDNVVARGLAVCSPMDVFNKKIGRSIALGRAVEAVIREQSFGPLVFHDAVSYNEAYLGACLDFKFKAEYLPEIVGFEKETMFFLKPRQVTVGIA